MQPVRLGLVGLNFGRWICKELSEHPDLPVRMTHVCDMDPERARAMSEEYHVPIAPDLDSLLADPEIDAIGLYTGPNGRADMIRKIIRAGKDVMTTKPFEIDWRAALDVLHEAKALGRVVHLNSPNARPYGEAAVIAEWLKADAIGRPVLGQSSVWVNYGPTEPDGTWYDDPQQCPAAPIFRLGIYPLNILLQVFGEPATVQVTHSRVLTLKPTADNASMTIGFTDGSIVNMVASFAVGGLDYYKNTLTIGGTKGVIYFKPGPLAGDDNQHGTLMLSTEQGVEYRMPDTSSGHYDWEFFAQRVRGEVTADVTTPEDIVKAIRVVAAMSKAQNGETVQVEAL
ncbi:MAG TPA: Gfo/Idh/MocA family oxidoreductase [Armatimonadota bacterium]|jgi:predicted dehydrogenase